MSIIGTAVSIIGTAMSIIGTAVSIIGTALSIIGTAVSIIGTAVSIIGTAMSNHRDSYVYDRDSCVYHRDSYVHHRDSCVYNRDSCVYHRDSSVYHRDSCVYHRDSSVYEKGSLCVFIHESNVRSVRRYCFVRNYAAVPVQLAIVILQYIGWCVLIVWAYVFNHFSCFCQFLVHNFCYSIMSLYTLGMCQLLTCCSSVLDRLRSFSTSSAQLIGVSLLQNIFILFSC